MDGAVGLHGDGSLARERCRYTVVRGARGELVEGGVRFVEGKAKGKSLNLSFCMEYYVQSVP